MAEVMIACCFRKSIPRNKVMTLWQIKYSGGFKNIERKNLGRLISKLTAKNTPFSCQPLVINKDELEKFL